jgi:hypothetical protein
LVHVVEFDAVEVDVESVERHGLVGEQSAHGVDDLAHHAQRLVTVDADLRRQRIPPRAEPQIIRPGARSSSVENVLASRRRVARPDVDHTRADLDAVGGGANAAIGTTASRTSRLSACHTASNPFDSA